MSEDAELSKAFPIMRDEKSGAILWKDLRSMTLQYIVPIGRLRKFFEGLARGVLYGARCLSCGARYFPPRADCSRCGSSNMEWVKVRKKGKLLILFLIRWE